MNINLVVNEELCEAAVRILNRLGPKNKIGPSPAPISDVLTPKFLKRWKILLRGEDPDPTHLKYIYLCSQRYGEEELIIYMENRFSRGLVREPKSLLQIILMAIYQGKEDPSRRLAA